MTRQVIWPWDRIRASAVWLALPFVVGLGAYAEVPGGGFVWDDELLIEGQAKVQSFAPLHTYFSERFWNDPLDPSDSFYRPLVTLSYAAEWSLWKGNPAGFHVTNLLLHLCVVAALVLLCRRTAASNLATGLAVSLFAVLPRLTESVAWISGRTDIMAAGFGLAALLVYRPEGKKLGRPVACALLMLAAMLCKEVAFALVLAVLVLEWRESRFKAGAALRLAPVGLAAAVAIALRVASRPSQMVTTTYAGPPWPERAASVFGAVGHYARMLADPLRPQLQIGLLSAPSAVMIMTGVAVCCALAFGLFKLRGRGSALQWAAVSAALAAIAMVVHLAPLNMPVLAADRFLYVPAAMASLIAASSVDPLLLRAPRAVLLLGLALVMAFAVSTHQRVLVWNDEYVLWKQMVSERDPRNSAPLLGLAGVLLDASLPERALAYLDQQVEEERQRPQLKTFSTRAVALSQAGQNDAAIAALEELSRTAPNALRIRLNLAMAYARAWRWADAERALAALDSEPGVRATVAAIREQLADARARSERHSGSAVEDLVEHAAVLDSLGATRYAELAWRLVLEAPAAPQQQRLRALRQLAFQGDPSRVASDFVRARAELGPLPEFTELQRVVEERDRLR